MTELYHFAVTDIQYLPCVPGVTVVVTTDTPCHLYMRWTNQLPLIHLDPYIRRGVAVGTRPRYCFDLYKDNEQFETGDSITHTFIKPSWACCETRYFYFWGCKFGYLMPSESTIFEHHNRYNDPQWSHYPVILPAFMLTCVDPNWPTVLTGWPDYQYIQNSCDIIHYKDASNYAIRRCGFSYDTTTLPIGSYICQAKIRVKDRTSNWWNPLSGDYWVNFVSGNNWDGGYDWSNYAIWNSYRDVCSEFYVPPQMTLNCREYPLTPLGLSKIITGGITRYIARPKDDVDQIPPTGILDNYTAFLDSAPCPSRLSIEYRTPC